MNRISVLLLCCAALLVPSLGSAQQTWDYPLTISPVQYQAMPLPGGAAPVPVLTSTTSLDSGNAIVTLPFPFTYYGNQYTTMKVNTDGYVEFGATATGTVLANRAVPNTAAPNNAVFLWHDDNGLQAWDGLKTQVLGTAGSRQFVVEWKAKRYESATTFLFEMQLWLSEGSPVIRVKYGPRVVGINSTASMGIENADGTQGTSGILPSGVNCNPVGTESSSTGCSAEQFPSGFEYMYGATNEPDLVPSLTLGAVSESEDGTQLTIPLTTTIRNQGLQPAAGVTWNFYFSNDLNLDANDPFMGAHPQAEAIGAMSSAEFPAVLTWPIPPTGEYRVCAWVDPEGAVADPNPGNNKACSTNAIVMGADPAAVSVAFEGAPTAVPGDVVTVRYKIQNLGTRSANGFGFDIKLSRTKTQSGAFTVHSGSVANLAPGAVLDETVQVRIPANLAGEQFYPFLEVNADRKFAEANTRNNTVFGDVAIAMLNPDILPKSVQPILGEGCFFGRETTISYEVCNNGASTAAGFVDAIFMHDATVTTVEFNKMVVAGAVPDFCSSDSECTALQQGSCIEATMGGSPVGTCHYGCTNDADCGSGSGLSCVADQDLGGQKSCQNVFMATQCRNVERVVTVPSVDPAGAPLLENRDYIFTVLLDPTEKLNEGGSVDKILNNVSKSGRLTCRYPAPNFSAISLHAPPRLAAGETVALTRDIQNIGNEPAVVAYRYVLSTNEIFSEKDVGLPLASTGGDGLLTLEAKKGSKATELVKIPGNVAPGEYFLGLVVDPQRTLHELDKTNNTIGVIGKVLVEPAGLQIRTPVLPTGTIGSYYGFQLLATGGSYDYVWSASQLPPALELSSNGYLSGRLTEEGRFPFTVEVRSGEASMTATVVLDVSAPRGPLVIDTTVLPVAYTYSTSPYTARISVSGGVPPYACTFDNRPNRFNPTAEDSCTLFANDGLERAGEHDFRVNVTDARGTRVSGNLHLSILESNRLDFKDRRFVEEGIVGQSFEACAHTTASRHIGRDTEDQLLYSWEMSAAPAGLATAVPNPAEPTRACLVGTPTECGTFMVNVRVETRLGEDGAMDEWAEAAMPLVVQCRQLMLESDVLPSVFRGDSLDVQLVATGPNAGSATFRVFAGQLPRGITLASNGLLHGIVADDASNGTHNFVVEISDGMGGHGLAGLAILVQSSPVQPKPVKPAEKSGCSTAADGGVAGALPFGIALLGIAGMGLRRRAAAPVRICVSSRKGPLAMLTLAALGLPMQAHAEASPMITSLSGESVGYPGGAMVLEGMMTNQGAEAASFSLRFQGSEDEVLADGAPELSAPYVADLAAGEPSKFWAEVVLPASIQSAEYRIFITVVSEEGTDLEQAVWGPFPVGTAMADALVVSVETPAAASRGDSIQVVWEARNRGSFAAEEVPYRVYLSSDRRISLEDRQVGSGAISLKDHGIQRVDTTITLPADIRAGTYFVGVVLDPDGIVSEITKDNNIGVSPTGFVVSGGELVLGDNQMPTAEIGASYCAALPVTGGNGTYQWSLLAGSELPAGLDLVEASSASTLLCGRPAAVGAFSFGLQVKSGAELVTGIFDIEVLPSGAPLSVLSTDLPAASFDVSYGATLRAVGGSAPYAWSLVEGRLPIGISLLMDGRVVGTPQEDGQFPILVQVADSVGQEAAKQVMLTVSPPARLTCVTQSLPTVQIGQELKIQLAAAGGKKPYQWESGDTRRLADGRTDNGALLLNEAPPGFVLDRATGVVTGSPAAVGRYTWEVVVRDATSSFVTDRCNIRVDVVSEHTLSIVTQQLADAHVGAPYRAQLSVAGVNDQLTWSLAANNFLPEGLVLSPGGEITGMLSDRALDGEKARTFHFVVQVRDPQHRSALAALSIRLTDAPEVRVETPPVDSSGCQAVAGAPGLLGLGVIAGMGLLRRRSRS